MSVKPYIPAIKYGNAITSDEVDLSGATGDVTFTAGDPQAGTASTTTLNPALAKTTTVSLTAANIAAMFSVPVQLLAAPGAGKFISVDSITFSMTPTTTSFTAGGVVNFYYHNTSVTAAGVLPAGYVTTGAAGVANPYVVSGIALAAASTNQPYGVLTNLGLDISNATAAFATGTGTAKVYVNYQIITL